MSIHRPAVFPLLVRMALRSMWAVICATTALACAGDTRPCRPGTALLEVKCAPTWEGEVDVSLTFTEASVRKEQAFQLACPGSYKLEMVIPNFAPDRTLAVSGTAAQNGTTIGRLAAESEELKLIGTCVRQALRWSDDGGGGEGGSGGIGGSGGRDGGIEVDAPPVSPGATCPEGTHRCGTSCVDNLSADTCGSSCVPCDPPDRGSATCDGQSCGAQCAPPLKFCASKHACIEADAPCEAGCGAEAHLCGAVCVKNDSVNGCGTQCTACAVPANATATCDGVKCGFTCNADTKSCGDKCVPKDACCSNSDCPDNATCGTGVCSCNDGFVACGREACVPKGTPCGGMCADPATHECAGMCVANASVETCGTRCSTCPKPANSKAVCEAGACKFVCDSGFKACGDVCIPNSGCCSSAECATNGLCTNHTCGCRPGYKACGSACIPATDCCTNGDCSVQNATSTCGADRKCTTPVCSTGYANCDSQPGCERTLGTNTSCGSCNDACASNFSCSSFKCTCTKAMCGNECVDTMTSANHCGSCNRACLGGCAAGGCKCITRNASNAVTNGGFDANIAGWTSLDAQILISWASPDAAECSSSGSMLIRNTAPDGLNSGINGPCVQVTPGAALNLGVIGTEIADKAQGQWGFSPGFFTESDCNNGSFHSFGEYTGGGFSTGWQQLSRQITVPSGVRAMRIQIGVVKNFSDARSYDLMVDMVHITPPPGSF